VKKVQVRPNVFISLTLQVLTTELASNVRNLGPIFLLALRETFGGSWKLGGPLQEKGLV
jgi:hypothetical protein